MRRMNMERSPAADFRRNGEKRTSKRGHVQYLLQQEGAMHTHYLHITHAHSWRPHALACKSDPNRGLEQTIGTKGAATPRTHVLGGTCVHHPSKRHSLTR